LEPTIVADACIIVKWFIPEPYSQQAATLRDDHLTGKIKVIAPKTAITEFANTIRKYVIRRLITREDAVKALKLLQAVEVQYIDIEGELLAKALNYSLENHVTVYDACYISLAHQHKTIMYTADEKLLKQLKNKDPIVKHIQEYPKDRKQLLKH